LTHASTRLNWLPRMKSRSRITNPMMTATSIRASVPGPAHVATGNVSGPHGSAARLSNQRGAIRSVAARAVASVTSCALAPYLFR
jgi:hypothetical protein